MNRDNQLIYEAYLNKKHLIIECNKGDIVQILNTSWMKEAFPKFAGKLGQIISVGDNTYLIKLQGSTEKPDWWFENNFEILK